MKLPINWLKNYINIPTDHAELIAKLTSIGHMQDGPAKNIAGDVVYELEIRQNRSDCLSILGLARESGAILNVKIKDPSEELKELPNIHDKTSVIIEDPKLCYRFNTVTISNLQVKESPAWLRERLEAYGIKTINNVVDITNFVMVEMGQPLHAYDKNHVLDQKIFIRKAHESERFMGLNNKEIILTQDDLVITDDQHILGLAGIIGGQNSAVTESTKEIILEDATYNQASIRRSSLRHNIRTEASTRHEKFLHPKLTEIALKRAVLLISEICGGRVTDHTDVYPKKIPDITILVDIAEAARITGIVFQMKEVQQILSRLEIPSTIISESKLEVHVPYFRTDLEQEADVIEEVLRIHGYDKIPDRLPSTPPPKNIESPMYQTEEIIKDILVSCGYDEQITDPLVKEDQPKFEPVILQNSLNSEKIMLRTTLQNNLLKVIENQKKFKRSNIHVFEVGKIYYKENDQYIEKNMMGLMYSSRSASYGQVKGVLEYISDRLPKPLQIRDMVIERINSDPTFFFEIELEKLIGINRDTRNILTAPPQEIFQDFSLFVPIGTRVGDIISAIKDTSKLVYKISLGEEPKIVNDDQKSVFLKLSFHLVDKEITNEDVEKERQKILALLREKFSAIIR